MLKTKITDGGGQINALETQTEEDENDSGGYIFIWHLDWFMNIKTSPMAQQCA